MSCRVDHRGRLPLLPRRPGSKATLCVRRNILRVRANAGAGSRDDEATRESQDVTKSFGLEEMLQQRLAGMNSALSGDGDGVNSDGSSDSGLRGRRLSGPAAAYANPGAGMLDALDRVASKSSQPKKEEEIDPTSIPWSVGSIPNAPEGEELLRAESTRDVAEALNEQARATAGSQEAEFLAEMAKQRRDAPPTKPRGEESTQPSASAQDRIKAALEYKRKREGSVSGDSNASEPRAPFLTTVSRVDESRAKEMLQGKGELERMLRAGEISEEQYSVRLEMLKRENTTVEFISVDKGYAPSRTKVADQGSPEGVAGQKQEGREGEGKQGPDYKPKVATWGVFPRPKNISTSFGGGRNIAPGQALETEEEREAATQRTRQRLEEYRRRAGLVVEKEDEEAAGMHFEEGMRLMKAGQLGKAVAAFDLALSRVPMRTVVGGNAALQKAICLDSMGQSEEARPIYAQLSKHSSAYVAKMANRMSFGFAAMKNLKADTISYAVSKKEWRPYFDTFTDRNYKVYVPPPDEVTDNTGAAVAALAVMALPLVLVGAFAYVH